MTPMFNSWARPALILLLLCSLIAGAAAQTPAAPAATETAAPAPAEADPFGRETPQGLVNGLIGALAEGDYERALRFLEVNRLSAGIGQNAVPGEVLAEDLQSVLDRSGGVATAAELSTAPAGHLDDGLDEDLERVGTLGTLDNDQKPLIARRIDRDGRKIWVISVESLRDAEALTRAVGTTGARSLLERVPPGPTVFGAPLSHWAAVVALVVVSLALAWLLIAARGLSLAVARRYFGESWLTRFVNASAGPVRLLLAVIIFAVAVRSVGVTVVVRYYATFVNQIVGLIAIAWLLWRSATRARRSCSTA